MPEDVDELVAAIAATSEDDGRAAEEDGEEAAGVPGGPARRPGAARRIARIAPVGRSTAGGRGGALAARLAGALAGGARAVGGAGRVAGRVGGVGLGRLADRLLQVAPRIPVRDAPTLRAHHPGLDTEELAEVLVRSAARASAGVGGALGAWAALPKPLSMPVELAAETLSVAAIEIKLIAELREVYGRPAAGTLTDRATAYVSAWADYRGVQLTRPAMVAGAVSNPLRHRVRVALLRRTGREVTTLVPFMVGAVLGATVNRRDTRRLGERVRADLRQGRVAPGGG
ncbi:hypothetical protein [Allostreptomyces psammosilenae]|uniref:Uncharacterized protein n=1 Tax=Allostreptomyces psammosilenae TaxID=1892865 RepID=A0A852ZWW2_9ACTN|nr:hypothetical protein [Allostreptomyces psammosilenae]NYI03141.1 hypothetical protein [Allostreptomyces psammosilenae]